MSWNESYSVGYEPIDYQHKGLFAISDRLAEAHDKSGEANEKELSKIVRDLILYAREHLADEEQLMQRSEYPDFQYHQSLHIKLEHELRKVEKLLIDGEVRTVTEFLPKFVSSWLSDHIATEDQKYSAYIKPVVNAELAS